ncbi:hypothetical protein [Halorubrum tropicale]|uniref:Uncharacterized protein n=1 Tax=Halorubrum tropicale TaxID=1765655 RepID=A0A0N0U9N8_9EURY|nr:hypothetical protein [Halorubrum tropicale]KOX94210.1 hypothetical protein AMR74_15975 [Halorubrum tropicale]
MSTATPTESRIAARLETDADDLRRFVEFHPDPDVEHVLSLVDVAPDDLSAGDRADLARWIAEIREKPNPEDLPGATPRLDGREFGRDQDLWWDSQYDKRGEVDGLHEVE